MEKKKLKARVLSGYRITIPKEIRERLGISIGDEVTIIIEGNRISIIFDEEEPVMLLAGIAEGVPEEKGDTISIKELETKLMRGKEK